ncbi:MAG: hypothetical protein KC590_16485 [Nitrospira sp.]|nr:hypothetical protein [Nitrospira sp.]MCA9463726.1 hypothetical protein [Nitrospira sp.]
MIVNSIVRMQIGLCLVLLLAVYGCGGGNAKNRLTKDDLNHLRNASHLYIIHYATPPFGWWFAFGIFPFPSSMHKLNLSDAQKKLNISNTVSLEDPTFALKGKVSHFMREQMRFSNITSLPAGFPKDDIMFLKQELGTGKVIDLRTIFWQFYPVYSRQPLQPEKESYQFQYSGIVRVIDLDTLSVIHQVPCHYPPKSRNNGQMLSPKESGTLFSVPTWENPLKVSEIFDGHGLKINEQVYLAVRHCQMKIEESFRLNGSHD